MTQDRSLGNPAAFGNDGRADTMRLRAEWPSSHPILPVGPCLGHTSPVVFTHDGRSLSSCWEGRRSEPIDPAEDVGEQVTKDSNLGHLEDDVATVADDLRADLDELFRAAWSVTTAPLYPATRVSVPSMNSFRRRNPGILGVPATGLAGCTEGRPVDDEAR